MSSVLSVLVYILLSQYGLATEKCKEIKYTGGPLLKGTMNHGGSLRIFVGKNYNVSHDGNILAWKFINVLAGSKFFLDVWKNISTSNSIRKFELIHKTEVSNPQLGVNLMRLATPIPVSIERNEAMYVILKF